MKWKNMVSALREALVSGDLSRQRPQLAQVLSWGLNLLLGLVLAMVPLLDGCAPFGVAIVAQAGADASAILCGIGAGLGYLLAFGFETGIRYVAAMVLVLTAAFAFREWKLARSLWFMPLVAACFTLLTGALGAISVVRGHYAVVPLLLQTCFAFGGCYFFREALRDAPRDTETAEIRHMVSLAVLSACILMSLSGVRIAGPLSLGRLVAVLAVMLAAYKGGALGGCAIGVTLGLAMDIVTYQTPFFAMAYGVCGLVAGIFSRHGRLMFLSGFVLTAATVMVCASYPGLRQELLMETLLCALVFALAPRRILSQLGNAIRPIPATEGESGLRRYTARRVAKLGEAFEDLYATVDALLSREQDDEDLSRIFDRASEQVCSRCKRKNECWNAHFLDTLTAFNDAVPEMQRRGLLLRKDLPAHFLEQCVGADALVGAINGELRGQMYRKRFLERLRENRSAAYSQYLDMARVLTDVSEELHNAYGPDVLARRRLQRYLDGLDLDADIAVFRDRSGRLHIVLESARLKNLLDGPGYLDRLSAVVGLRLCRPGGEREGEGRITLLEAEPLSASVGIATLKKQGESVSGDRGTYFKTEQGVLCIILSDGMGSGEDAARESVAAVRILERFLRAGMDPATAMKILNSMMLLKNEDDWGFATVDLMTIDLFTGEAVFYKYGAAPSYVRSGKTVKRIRSETLAAGLQSGAEAMPDVVRLRLKPDTLAIIASDGVIAETDDGWIRTLLAEFDGEDTKSLARETLQTALHQYGRGDDMTVLAVRIAGRA